MNGRGRVVVVGASLAGLRAAQALRRRGHLGGIVLVGDEPHPPYDRPPLSKQLLDGTGARSRPDLPVPADLDVRWHLGRPARALDLAARRVHLADGRHLDHDGLVVATGARARPWPGPTPRGVRTLRTADDALALSAAMGAARHLLVVGAGFLGGEVAAAARRRGLAVTLVERRARPLLGVGGHPLGDFVADLHREAGVDLRVSTRVRAFTAGAGGGLTGADLDDGSHGAADLAVVALGAQPSTDWLAGSGLQLDRGLVCDGRCRPLLLDGTPAAGVVAAGDVVRRPHPLSDGLLSLGHWANAGEQAEVAAAALLQPDAPLPPDPVPSAWSDLHGVRIRSVGLPQQGDEHHVVEHDPDRRRLVLIATRRGRLVGAVTANRTSRLAPYRAALQQQMHLRHGFARGPAG